MDVFLRRSFHSFYAASFSLDFLPQHLDQRCKCLMKLLQLQLFSAFPRRKDRFLLGPEPSVDTQPLTKKSS